MSTSADEFLKGLFIPPQPRLLLDISAAGDDVDRVAKLIAADPGTAAAVLKAVNSAAFGQRREIASIRHAVTLMGQRVVTQLVSGLQLRLSMANARNKVDLDPLWDASQDVATLAAAISRQMALDNVEEAYTLGLFHNAGVAVLALNDANYLPIHAAGYRRAEGMEATELLALQTSHAQIGGRVAKVWKLPQRLGEGITWHHQAEKVLGQPGFDEAFKTLLAILKIAEHWAALYRRLGGADTDHEWLRVSGAVREQLGLSEVDYEDLHDSVAARLGSIPNG